MDGFHSLWSKPYMAGKQAEEYWMQDYEVLTMILSALMWRKYNGGSVCVRMKRQEHLSKLGLAHIWNLGIEKLQCRKRYRKRCSGQPANYIH